MFDLDGTLADTLRDIAEAGNFALAQLDQIPKPVADYRYLAGQGVRYLIEHALGPALASDDNIDQGIAHFRAYYAEHKYDHSGPFAGIPELLDNLTERQKTLAVLSNKPDDAAVQVVDKMFSNWQFAQVRGHRETAPLKPDPLAALQIAEELHIAPRKWVYVGDTSVDVKTGKAAGMFTVGVTWGFRDEAELRDNGADAIVHKPEDIAELVI